MEKMEVRVVRGADTYTCTCNSCIMGFTVYEICTARGLYVLSARGSTYITRAVLSHAL